MKDEEIAKILKLLRKKREEWGAEIEKLKQEKEQERKKEEETEQKEEAKQTDANVGQGFVLGEEGSAAGVEGSEKGDELVKKEKLRRKRELERIQRKAVEIQKVLEADSATGKIYLNTKCYGCKSVQRKELVGLEDRWLQFKCIKCGASSYIAKEDFQRFKDTRARILEEAKSNLGQNHKKEVRRIW